MAHSKVLPQVEQRDLLHLVGDAFGAHQAISEIGLAGGVITGLSASDIHATTLPQRQSARKHTDKYYGTTLVIFGALEITP